MATEHNEPTVEPPAPSSSAVGQALKAARLRTGKDLTEVATQLRIRQPFLAALEDGRHKDLPGGTYAVGFLRTYAEFLGLDGEEMVRRFRQEAAGDLAARAELVFPSPASEGRIPGGAVLFLGLLVAAAAYGAWYWMSSKDATVAEIVPPLPDRLSGMLNRPANVAADKPAEPAKPDDAAKDQAKADPAKPAETETSKPTGQEVVPPAEDEAQPAATPDAAKPADAAKSAEAPKPATDIKPADTKPAEPKPELKPAEVKPAALPAKVVDAPKQPEAAAPAAPVAMPKASEPVKTPEAPKPAEVAKPAEVSKLVEAAKPTEAIKPVEKAAEPEVAAPASVAADGKVIGQENTGSRITLKAVADDCWVQVRELDGKLLMSRLLRRGDTYLVPNRPGLSLMAGNAGALEILVDGKKVPSLGTHGQVRRDIKLDADKLGQGVPAQ